MDDSQHTSNSICCFDTKEKRGQAIDSALGNVSTTLNALNEAKDFVPVAGVGVVIPVLKAIVDQIRLTRTNTATAVEIARRVGALIRLLKETVDGVKAELERLDVGDTRSHVEQSNKPTQFDVVIQGLERDLKPLTADIQKAQEGSFFSRLWHSGAIETQLGEVNDKISNALEDLRIKQSTIIHAMTVEIFKEMMNAKHGDALDALRRVEVTYLGVVSEFLAGTRVNLIDDVDKWLDTVDATDIDRVYMISGEAGTGKSTVTREICHRLELKKQLGASYFFVRSDGTADAGGLASVEHVIPAIAWQLATLHPVFRPYVASIASEYKNSQSKSPRTQLETLILGPLSKVRKNTDIQFPKGPIVIVLDALDEARGDLDGLLQSLKHLLDTQSDFRILVTTRPERSVMHAFTSVGMGVPKMRTDMGSIPSVVVKDDIKRYIAAKFNKLEWKDLLLSMDPYAVETLAALADELFIFARTVMSYLAHKTPEVSTQRYAQMVTKVEKGTKRKNRMTELDCLYGNVLQGAYDGAAMDLEVVRARVAAVLGGLVVLQDPITIKILVPLMGVKEDEATRTVEELRSIVTCAGDIRKDAIRPLHLTLREFLVDEERCPKGFYVDRREHHLQVVKSCLLIMNNGLRRDMCELGDTCKEDLEDLESRVQERIPAHVRYACLYWIVHLVESDPTTNADVQLLLEEFCTTKMLEWIEVLSLMNRLDSAVHALLRAHAWVKVFTRVATILEDAYRLVARFYEPINEFPAQIYISALSFAPECLLVDLYAKQSRSKCVVSRERLWGTSLSMVSARRGGALYSRDGKSILSWTYNEIVIRDALTGNAQKTLRRENEIVSADIHPNGRFVVYLLEDGTVEEWDWTSESQATRIYALPEVNRSKSRSQHDQVMYGGDGSRIVCYRENMDAIFVWSTGDQTQPAKRIPIPTWKRCIAFSLGAEGMCIGALLTSEDELAIVKRWDVETGEEVSSMQIEMDGVERAVFAKNNETLVTGHSWKLCVWSFEGDCWTLTTTIDGYWYAFDVTRSGDLIASGVTEISLWNPRSGEKLGEHQGHMDWITSLGFSAQEDRLVSTSWDDTLRIWDTRREALPLSSDHTLKLRDVTISPNGKRIAATAFDVVHVFDSNDGSLRTKFTGHTNRIESLAFSADGSLLATHSGGDGVFLWDVEGRSTHPRELPQSTQLGEDLKLIFNTDATLLAVVLSRYYSFAIQVWRIESHLHETKGKIGKRIFQSDDISGFTPHCIRFNLTDPLSRLRHLDQDENEVIIWDHTRNAVETCAYDENTHSALKLAFAQERGWIVSTRTRRRLLWLPEDSRTQYASDFAVNGAMIAICSDTGKFTVLDMSCLSSL